MSIDRCTIYGPFALRAVDTGGADGEEDGEGRREGTQHNIHRIKRTAAAEQRHRTSLSPPASMYDVCKDRGWISEYPQPIDMKRVCGDQPTSPQRSLDVLCGASLLLSPCFRRARSQNTSLLFRRRAGSERAAVDVNARGALARMNNRQWGIRVGAEGGNK